MSRPAVPLAAVPAEPPPAVDVALVPDLWLKAVGLQVKLARVRGGWSQEELAARSAVSRATVSSIERADHPAAVTIVRQVATILGLGFGRPIRQTDEEMPP